MAFLAGALAAPAAASATTFTVNTVDDLDDGSCDAIHCSLREAIGASNADFAPDDIHFDILGPGPHSIKPLSQLPTITDPVVIDGATEPDYAGSPVVELDGSLAPGASAGLHITSGDSIVRALVVTAGPRPVYGSTRGPTRSSATTSARTPPAWSPLATASASGCRATPRRATRSEARLPPSAT